MAALVPPQLPDALLPLRDLALDLRWTWSHEADALWERIDADLWDRSHSPWTLLQSLPPERLDGLARDAGFLAELGRLAAKRNAYVERPSWFEGAHGRSALGGVAYFSMEFGLGTALPLYAGGLGVLAGDFLKAASDLGVPVTGVGLLYQEGYFRQVLDAGGGQREAYPYNDPATMPIEPALVDGVWLRVPVGLPGRILQLRVWRAAVGRAELYLLDSNDPLNSPSDRGITATLYGGDAEMRLMQELVLGVGGWRMLAALRRDIDICHLNEGHAAFAAIERARSLAARTGLGFWEAFWATRPGNVFTTHTPVAAGFDRFPRELIAKYLDCEEGLLGVGGPSLENVLGLGRAVADDQTEPFNMAFLAMRGAGACLAVSRIHERVSRRIFQPLFPRWPEREIPVGHVTNGVHTPTWDSDEADRVWTEACGKERWRSAVDELPGQIACVSDEDIWAMRGASRQQLIGHVRSRLGRHLRSRGLAAEDVETAEVVFDANVLTLGFARRFTDYKRPNLLLRDQERLARILLDDRHPVQIVVAGKAHPADAEGKEMIREWIAVANQPRFRRRVVFLEDYDLALAQELVRGVDVWINTPRRPWEACGTSGMKVLVNGGLNCSVLDGWWGEAYQPGLGWRIGLDGDSEGNARDAADAEDSYDLIERQIAPEFYQRDETGIPRAWVARIRRSMSVLTAAFSSTRMVSEYIEGAYLPAAAALRGRQANGFALAKDLAGRAERLERTWGGLHIGSPTVTRADDRWRFTAPVFLGEIAPDEVRVELYADPAGDTPAPAIPLAQTQAIPGAMNGFVFAGEAPASRPAGDYTVRVTPARPEGSAAIELPLIAWQT